MTNDAQVQAREHLIQAVLRRVSSERSDESYSDHAAGLEYCDDMIEQAAKDLVRHDLLREFGDAFGIGEHRLRLYESQSSRP